MSRRQTRFNRHHIFYGPDWTVDINWLQHKAITNAQQKGSTPENYANITDVMHALWQEWNRLRAELDTGEDFKIIMRGKEMFKPKPKPKIKRRKKRKEVKK